MSTHDETFSPRSLRSHGRALVLVLLGLTATVALVGCGGDDDSASERPPLVEVEVAPTGGTVEVPGTAVRLVFPDGALDAATTITVAEADRAPRDVVGTSLELGPDGIEFDAPVELRFDFSAADVSGSVLPDDFRVLTWNGAAWVEVEGAVLDASRADEAGTLVAPLEHFSTYAVARVSGADAFLGTYGTAADDVFALGTDTGGNGLVSRWDGGNVVTAHTLPGGRFVDGWAAAPDDHYALAYDGTGRVLGSPDGSTWTELTTHPQALVSIHGIGAERIAVGYDQTILEYDGSSWTDASLPGLLPAQNRRKVLRGVAMTAPGEAFAVGDDTLLRRSGGSWNPVDTSALFSGRFSLRSVWARAADDVYAAGWEFFPSTGNRGVVLHFDGSGWSREVVIGAPNLRGVWGGANDVLAVGNSGTLLRKQGTWTTETVGSTATLYDVWAADDTTLAFVGAEGVFHYPGFDDPGTGGGGGCTGAPDDVLDFRTGAGVHACNTPWTMQGYTMEIRAQLEGQVQECATAASQDLCLGNDDFSEFGEDWSSMWLSSCDRLIVDLADQPGTVACVEIDVRDFCDTCTGGVNGGTVAYLYDASGNVIDLDGTTPAVGSPDPSAPLKTLTLDGSSATADRLDICFTYGGLFEIRVWYR